MVQNDKNDEIKRIEARIGELDSLISAAAESQDSASVAALYFERGRARWRLGEKGKAISDYECAASLDATSPAAEALALARRIMDFYNTDLYNP